MAREHDPQLLEFDLKSGILNLESGIPRWKFDGKGT
jgi:hypothetical protein